jgi:AraC-like DNA-binding protein
MSAVFTPPHYARRIASDDLDEVSAWAARLDGYHSRVVHGTGPYGFEAAELQGLRVWIGWGRTRLRQTLRGCAQRPMFHIPIDRPQQYSFGRQRIVVAPGEMTFMATGTETTRHSDAGSVLAIDLDGAALTTEVLRRHPGAAEQWPQFPLALQPRDQLWRALGQALAELVRAFDPGAAATQRAHCESQLIATLADALTSRTGGTDPGRLAAQRVAALEAWIDEHLGDVITIGRLCEAAQVSERSLQLAFQARRGMSPMRFVCERRLAAAHRRISNAETGDSITAIATSLGFSHLGRFSLSFRETFGESPSQTWLRKQGTAARRDPAAPAPESG